MDTMIREVEVSPLGIGGIAKTRPPSKLITRLKTIVGLCVDSVVIHPYACYELAVSHLLF